MYDKDILSVGECSPGMANKGVCILFVKDDPPCDTIVDVMLQHRAQEVLAFGDISCVLYAVGMAKDRIESVITNAHNLEPHGVEIVQFIENEFGLPTMLMQPNGKRMMSNNRLHLFSSISIASVLYGLSPNEVNVLWTRGLNSVKEKTTATYAVDKNRSDATVAGRVKVKQKGIIRKHEPRKKRLEWTAELHSLFEKAYNELGPEKAVPKRIAEHMGVPGLTRDKVASHLQKYRNSMKLQVNQGSLSSSSETEEFKGIGVLQSYLHESYTPAGAGPGLCSPNANVSISTFSSQHQNLHTGFSFSSTSRSRICMNLGGLQLHGKEAIIPPRMSNSFAGYILKNDGTSIELAKQSDGNILRDTPVSAPVTSNRPIITSNLVASISQQPSVMGREPVMYGNENQTSKPLTVGAGLWFREQPDFPSPNYPEEMKISYQSVNASVNDSAENGSSLQDRDACTHFVETLLNYNLSQPQPENGFTSQNASTPSSSVFPCEQDLSVLLLAENLGNDFQVRGSTLLYDGISQELQSPDSLPERILDGFRDKAGSSVDLQPEWLDLDFD